jgi:dUTP pyrophosphatase
MILKIFKLNPQNPVPGYMTLGASGIDLYASLDAPIIIPHGQYRCIPAGIKIALPKGYEAQIRPRSGLALKNGVTVLNTPGTVDNDYRGEIKVLLINHGDRPFRVDRGMRIAQLVVAPVTRAEVWEVPIEERLESTERNEGGFGHTGI